MSRLDRIRSGDRLALSRLLTAVENETPDSFKDLSELYPFSGQAFLLGVTGSPGTGKSTLVNRLLLTLRNDYYQFGIEQPPSVAVVAVDPTSPFSGGAILGDRIRMQDLSGDSGVFIRSMASRGSLGGLANTTMAFVDVLDAAGFDWVVIETVGAGQAEVEIAGLAHTTLVIEAPGLGDEVQAIKAGILEIADILVLNKADLPGKDQALKALRLSIEMIQPTSVRSRSKSPETTEENHEASWIPEIIPTVSNNGDGFEDLIGAILKHRKYLDNSGMIQRRVHQRAHAELYNLVRQRLMKSFVQKQPDGSLEDMVDRIAARKLAPWDALEELLD